MMKKGAFLFLVLLVSCNQRSCRDTKKELASSGQGEYLYETHCASCHGSKGDGKGPVADFLWPKPRDFTSGIFKYRTTRGAIPSDYDILQTMKKGVPGTSMPGWDMLSADEWRAILDHVKFFSKRLPYEKAGPSVDIPEEPKATPEFIQAGRALYEKSGCVACHGPQGRGDGAGAIVLKDVWGDRVAPRDLTQGPLKWGTTSRDLYRTLMLGVPGTPMPAFEHTFSENQLWGLVHYLQSIQKPFPEGYDPSDPKRNLISVVKTEGDLPLDYEEAVWSGTSGVPVFLKPLWHETGVTEWLNVKALHNGKEMAVLVEWEDDEMNTATDQSDGVAIQWPQNAVTQAVDLPYVGMGSKARPVKIRQWKANGISDFVAVGAGNLEIKESLNRNLSGKGIYHEGKWHVILKMPFSKTGYLSFALWDADLPTHRGPEVFSEWMIYAFED